MKAFRWLQVEIAAGRRAKHASCDACGQSKGILDMHSEDYSAPYGDHIGAFTFCYRCHMMIHMRFRKQFAFEHYAQFIAEGKRYSGMDGRNFNLFCQQMLSKNNDLPELETCLPNRLLFEIQSGRHAPGGVVITPSQTLAKIAKMLSSAS